MKGNQWGGKGEGINHIKYPERMVTFLPKHIQFVARKANLFTSHNGLCIIFLGVAKHSFLLF